MLLKIISIAALVTFPLALGYGDGDEARQQYLGEDDDDSFGSYHQGHNEDVDPVRLKRFEIGPTAKTLSPQNIQDVKNAIHQILSEHQQIPFTLLPPAPVTDDKRSTPDDRVNYDMRKVQTPREDHFEIKTNSHKYDGGKRDTKSEEPINDPSTTDDAILKTSTVQTVESYDTEWNDFINGTIISSPSLPQTLNADDVIHTINTTVNKTTGIDGIDRQMVSTKTGETSYETKFNTDQIDVSTNALFLVTPQTDKDNVRSETNNNLGRVFEYYKNTSGTAAEDKTEDLADATNASPTRSHHRNLIGQTRHRNNDATATEATTTDAIFMDYDANSTEDIVAKCYVCGLKEYTIPRTADCADPFAADFLPLLPVDQTARSRLVKYRKFCRYADIPEFILSNKMPRSMFGRWTGGCSVRWIDLSGVYTQRSCRIQGRPVQGNHFASKRMAKLELALINIENGCIASPMATMVPLSRGISLFARFHACVCTGNWCNAANLRIPWTAASLVFLTGACVRPHLLLY